MKFNKITLFNYGPFCGEHSLDFATPEYNDSSYRNIVLIGGKNGSGKTSLFQAIQICLYGQTALGTRTSKTYYENFLKQVIHKSKDHIIKINESFIEVSFSFSVAGQKDYYCVKRSWMNKNDTLVEVLFVSKNGQALDVTEQSRWQDFVKNLIPQGLLQLFFFDGERINSLTHHKNNIQFTESIQTLFGLDVINQLKEDLRQYERRKLKSKAAKEIEISLKILDDQLLDVEHKIVLSKEKQAHLQVILDSVNRDIDQEEKEIRSIGSSRLNRDDLKGIIKRFEQEILEKKARLRNLFQQTLPLYYAKDFMKFSLERIDLEQKIRRRIELKSHLGNIWQQKKSKIQALLRSKKDINELLDILLEDRECKTNKIVHDTLNETTIAELKRCFETDVPEQYKQAKKLVVELEKKEGSLTSLQKKLQNVPDDQQIGLFIQKINGLSQKKGKISNQIKQEQKEEEKLNSQQNRFLKKRELLLVQLDELASHNRRLNLVGKTNQVLDIFKEKLVQARINELEKNILRSFNTLLRKGNIIKSLYISQPSFDITLEDKSGLHLETSRLSEGEKQVYAISILSGIAKTTNKPLPIFFDTPLGRLDSEHRENIIHKYFPTASHQVIVLSTDTEIDKSYFEELKQYVSHSYLLDFDKKAEQTTVKQGYFWD